jgi:hypothetical protein
VFADVTLREFVAEQEIKAVETLLWGKVEPSEFSFAGDGRDEISDEWALGWFGLQWESRG